MEKLPHKIFCDQLKIDTNYFALDHTCVLTIKTTNGDLRGLFKCYTVTHGKSFQMEL